MRKKSEDVMRRNEDTNKYMKALSKKTNQNIKEERGRRKNNIDLINRLIKPVIEQQ